MLFHTSSNLVEVGPVSWVAEHLNHLVKVALSQDGLPLKLVRQLLQLLLPQLLPLYLDVKVGRLDLNLLLQLGRLLHSPVVLELLKVGLNAIKGVGEVPGSHLYGLGANPDQQRRAEGL